MGANLCRSWHPGTGDADIGSIKNALQKDFAESLRLASAELRIPFPAIRKVVYDKLGLYPYKKSFSSNCCQKTLLAG